MGVAVRAAGSGVSKRHGGSAWVVADDPLGAGSGVSKRHGGSAWVVADDPLGAGSGVSKDMVLG